MKQNRRLKTTLSRLATLTLLFGATLLLAPKATSADPVHYYGGVHIGIGLPGPPVDRYYERERLRREWIEHHRWRRAEFLREERHEDNCRPAGRYFHGEGRHHEDHRGGWERH